MLLAYARHFAGLSHLPVTFLNRLTSSSANNKSLLAKLRRSTGFPIGACREALQRHENNVEQATTWLKEAAVARGWDKAGKVSGRAMSDGLLGVLQHRSRAVIVEVNCETDFVTRNDQFQNFVAAVTETAIMNFTSELSRVDWTTKHFLTMPDSNSGQSVADNVAVVIGAIGENVAVRRGLGLWCGGEAASQIPSHHHELSRLASYTHISTAGIRAGIRDVKFGKYAAIVRYRPAGEQATPAWHERAARLGKQLCQHIVGMNPRPGLQLTEPSADPEEERCLLWQPFFLDESIRVGEHLSRNDMILEDFVRFECGQEDEPCSINQPIDQEVTAAN